MAQGKQGESRDVTLQEASEPADSNPKDDKERMEALVREAGEAERRKSEAANEGPAVAANKAVPNTRDIPE